MDDVDSSSEPYPQCERCGDLAAALTSLPVSVTTLLSRFA
jgi:hypothetical protein